ncbi:hypothetical protein CMO91_03230 [Candidatus Woesearchaeota archaeon]|nr:hypothetical protein [Candidatus Woesearchaeota archaeon]
MRGVWFLLLLMVPVVQADLFPTGTAKRLPPLNGADGFVCSLNDQGPCFMGLTRAKSKCGPEKYIFEIRVDKNKGVGQTRIRSNSVCGGGDDTGWVDGIKKSGTFRCMSDSGRTCQCHRPWESTCEYNVNMIGDDRVQFIVDPRAGAPLNSPVMSLQQHQCALGFEKCNKNKELIKCERQSKFTFAEENKGLVIGKCGVTKNFLCNNVGGKVLEGGCCTGATSFSSPKAVTKCESKPLFTLAGLKFFTVQRCKPGKGDRACFNGKIIPNKAFAIADKVVNVGGKLLGCGLTPPLKKLNEVVATASTTDKTKLITVFDPLEIPHTKAAAAPIKPFKNPAMDHLTREAKCPKDHVLCKPGAYVGGANTRLAKCCPVDTKVYSGSPRWVDGHYHSSNFCGKEELPCGIRYLGGGYPNTIRGGILCCSAPDAKEITRRGPITSYASAAADLDLCKKDEYVCGLSEGDYPGPQQGHYCCKAKASRVIKKIVPVQVLAVKKTNKPLVKEVPLCTTLDFGTAELVCKNKDGQERWVSIKQDENKKKGQQSKQAPTLGKAKAGTAGCCPFDKCWDGERCVDLGTVIEVSETKALVCAASSTQVKT